MLSSVHTSVQALVIQSSPVTWFTERNTSVYAIMLGPLHNTKIKVDY